MTSFLGFCSHEVIVDPCVLISLSPCIKLYAGKEDWPELLGAEGTVAKETIERENSTVKAEIVLEGTIVPADLVRVCDRVRVWVDTCGIVTRVPTIG